ncbi:hypothetical protein D1007_46489 [Hordeum vulgare]|nr:hypothetical protein D1007_46489 [Hordeum vulgare]
MDPTEILNVRFHIGGEFVRQGSNLEYVGGDEEMSEIERDKLSFQEVKGFLKDHMEVKDSMKLYFLIPDYICVGGVADIYIEYHQEEDKYNSSGSDFEDELMDICESDASQPDHIISAEPAQDQEEEEYVQLVHDVFVTDCSGVITEVIKSPAKQPRAGRVPAANDEMPSQLAISQVCNPTQDARPTEFRPPRQTTGASGSGARGATRHMGRKDAEDYPSYRYFTARSGGQD